MSNKLWSDPDKTASDLFAKHDVRMNKSCTTLGRILAFGIGLWVVWVIFCLAIFAGLGYVAWHFISKAW